MVPKISCLLVTSALVLTPVPALADSNSATQSLQSFDSLFQSIEQNNPSNGQSASTTGAALPVLTLIAPAPTLNPTDYQTLLGNAQTTASTYFGQAQAMAASYVVLLGGQTLASMFESLTLGLLDSPYASLPSNYGGTGGGNPPTATATPIDPPPMGWSTWNSFANAIDLKTVEDATDGLVALNAKITSGPKYEYVNTDEGWWMLSSAPKNGGRDTNGNIIVDTTKWPGGMAAVATYIHGKGLKAGIYTDAGGTGCTSPWLGYGGGGVGSGPFVVGGADHYDQDMLTFAQWGFDYVKVDWCGAKFLNLDPQAQYTKIMQSIQKAYQQTGKLLVLNICEWGTTGPDPSLPDYNLGPWAWAAGVGRQWRTTGDIMNPGNVPTLAGVLGNFNGSYHPFGQHTGYYNDADMMVAGMGGGDAMDQTHIALWAILGSPMILGNDLTQPVAATTAALLTNPEVIAVDQDPLGVQGLMVSNSSGLQIWSKLLAGSGARAVTLLNTTSSAASMNVTWQELGLDQSSSATVRDLWAQKDQGSFTGSYTASSVPAGGVVMLKVTGTDLPPIPVTQVALANGASYGSCAQCQGGQAVTNLGSVTYSGAQSANGGQFIQIGYVNGGTATAMAQLSMNGATGDQATTLAFPTTNGAVGSVVVYAPTQSGANTITLSKLDAADAPEIASVAIVAGPVSLIPPPLAYEADASGNIYTGGAKVAACTGCADGNKVGDIGNGSGNNGTLTISSISAPANGTYNITVAYINGDTAARTAFVSFNGASAVSVSFPPTGDWNTPGFVTVSGVLALGDCNTMTFSNSTAWAPDISGLTAPVLAAAPATQ